MLPKGRSEFRRIPAAMDWPTATVSTVAMALLHRLLTAVDRTTPTLVKGQPIEPPPPLSDEESWRLNALADVVASDEIRNLMTAWTRKQSDFFNAIWYLHQVQQREQERPSETKAAYGVTILEQWQKVDGLRKELWEDAQAIGARVRLRPEAHSRRDVGRGVLISSAHPHPSI